MYVGINMIGMACNKRVPNQTAVNTGKSYYLGVGRYVGPGCHFPVLTVYVPAIRYPPGACACMPHERLSTTPDRFRKEPLYLREINGITQ